VCGEAPPFITRPILATESQPVEAASILLNKYIGAQEHINFDSLVDPTLDFNDVVYVKTNGAKVDRLVIIDRLSIPLSP